MRLLFPYLLAPTDDVEWRNILFSPFVVSCDGVLENEAKVVLRNLAGSLAKKSEKSYSETTNVMKSRMSIAIVLG